MNFNKELEIYGSYEQTNTKMITGHNARYMVGGTARHTVRSNIVDLRMIPKEKSEEEKTKLVSDILNIDPTELYSAFIKTLKFDEPINIQLRRLFYILKTRYPSTKTSFCQFEPKVRIFKLLDEIDTPNIHQITPAQKEQLDKLIAEIYDLCRKRDAISKSDNWIGDESIVDRIIDYYKNNYKALYKIEDINIQIAQLLERMSEILEQSEYID
jgi:hypothetical protein